MPDILKVTTPIINKNQAIQPKTGIDPLNPFTITDPQRVIRTHNQSDLLRHNTSLNDNSEAPVLLMNLLKDPAVAVSYLKNIFLLEEIFKLLPANNNTLTKEIEQLCQALIMDVEDVKDELLKQEKGATQFRGELFDFLRDISANNRSNFSLQFGIANLLKSINNIMAKGDIYDSVANSLEFVKANVYSNASLLEKVSALIAKFRQSDTMLPFPLLKEETLAVMKEIESSLLFSPRLQKVLSIITYNLSRHNDNFQYFNESAFRLRQMLMNSDDKRSFIKLITDFASSLRGNNQTHVELGDKSRVMDALINLVNTQSTNEEINLAEGAKIDNILHSLLSSPCNFTPLLHFVLPVIFNDVKAFAEIWINPDSDDKDMPGDAERGKHFLMVIEVESVGRFEAEIFSHDRIIDFFLFCPDGYQDKLEDVMKSLPKVLGQLNYKLGQTKLESLDTGRSLMQVFKSLPYKRVGVDVKI